MESKDILKAYWEYCFTLWRWRWQVDLEQDMENNFFDAFLWVLYDNKTSMPLHTVSVNWDERAVRYRLRSDKWKEWVIKTTEKEKEEMLEFFNKLIKENGNNENI